MPRWIGKWRGGRKYRTADGRTVWVIQKDVHGVTRSITTAARNQSEAEAELALFTRDRAGYWARYRAPLVQAGTGIITLDDETIGRYLDHQKAGGRTERYRKNLRTYLAAWAAFYAGRDIRTVPLAELAAELGRPKRTARKSRIIALKSFTAYLREIEATLPASADPTTGLRVPPPRPEKAVRDKGYTLDHVEKIYAAIHGWTTRKRRANQHGDHGQPQTVDVQCVRDVVVLHAKCGLHATEIDRLARGEGEIKPLTGHGAIAGTLKVVHKSGRVHIQSLDAQTLAALQRLRARGSAPVDSYVRSVIDRAAKRAKVPTIRVGQLRHSFVTWAAERGTEVRPAEGGLSLAQIAAAVGHASPNTTARFYLGVKVPPMVQIPIKLAHPKDPPVKAAV